MTQIKIHNDGYYAHAQTSNAYNFCLRIEIQLNLQENSWDII